MSELFLFNRPNRLFLKTQNKSENGKKKIKWALAGMGKKWEKIGKKIGKWALMGMVGI